MVLTKTLVGIVQDLMIILDKYWSVMLSNQERISGNIMDKYTYTYSRNQGNPAPLPVSFCICGYQDG